MFSGPGLFVAHLFLNAYRWWGQIYLFFLIAGFHLLAVFYPGKFRLLDNFMTLKFMVIPLAFAAGNFYFVVCSQFFAAVHGHVQFWFDSGTVLVQLRFFLSFGSVRFPLRFSSNSVPARLWFGFCSVPVQFRFG